jgi:diguanylate cyclase (GGDEF)-like protein
MGSGPEIRWAEIAADGRERAQRRPGRRELRVDLAMLAVFGAAQAALLLLADGTDGWSWTDALVLGAAYIAASRIELDVGSGYTVPTQAVLVVALLVLPPALVPLWVLAALVASDLPAVLRRRLHPLRVLIAGGDAIHAVAPAAVLVAAGLSTVELANWPVYVVAIAAQFALDLVLTLTRERLRVGVAPSAQLHELGFLYGLDATLAPIGLCAALAAEHDRFGYVLILPALVFAHMLASERRGRMDHEVALAKVNHAATTDVLTGVLNRRGWEEHLERLLDAQERRFTVAVLDVDDLKSVNDTHGHAAGDELLTAAADSWQQVLRSGDVIGRLGGDEFAVCFADRSETDVVAIGERLRSSLPDGHTCSVGFATAGPDDSLRSLFERADRRLYEDKRRSRDLVRAG